MLLHTANSATARIGLANSHVNVQFWPSALVAPRSLRRTVVAQASADDEIDGPSTSTSQVTPSSPRGRKFSKPSNGGRGGRSGQAGRGRGGRGGQPKTAAQILLNEQHYAAAAELRKASEGDFDGQGEEEEEEEVPAGGRVKYDRYEELDENDPMFTPVLTDEDLAEDPPGHRSGYVAVIGKPNAGKSTLINAIVGQKLSIVSYKPQTTRHRIVGITSSREYQMILFDTPGIIERKRNKLEERMMSAVVSSIQAAEAIVAVVDSRDHPQEALAMFQPGSNWTGPPMAVLLNKSDLLSAGELEELTAWYKDACKTDAIFHGSALNNEGVAEIKAWAVSKLPEGPTLYPKGIVSEQPERFFVSELIREKIFLLYEQEVPYSTQVDIVDFKERRGNKDFISAQILVEKDSQVGILIGKNGMALKQLGQESRVAIEDFLERPVYLELSVKVAKDWRESKESLEKYGYFNPSFT